MLKIPFTPNNINKAKCCVLSIRPSSFSYSCFGQPPHAHPSSSCSYGRPLHASFFFLFLRPSSSCSCSYGHCWPIHLLLPLHTTFFFFVFLFLRCFFFLSLFVFMIVPCRSSSSSTFRTAVILFLCLQQKKWYFSKKNPIRIINPYGSYGLLIHMTFFCFFLSNNFFLFFFFQIYFFGNFLFVNYYLNCFVV